MAAGARRQATHAAHRARRGSRGRRTTCSIRRSSTCSRRDPKTERIAHIYEDYRKELRKANALDFDDLLLEAVRLLKSSAQVREYYNRRYQYMLVDEYQDTNRPQYELMRMLAGEQPQRLRRRRRGSDRSIHGAAPTSATSSSSSRIFPRRRSSASSRTIARRRTSWRPRRPWSRTTSGARARICGPTRQGGAKIGYYEAPDGENEALFAADCIAKYLREADRTAARLRAPPCSIAPTRNRGCLKKRCAATA